MNFQLRKILKTIFKIIGVLNKVAFICILTIGLSSAAGNNNSSWSTLRVGTQIYTGSDGMGVITQTVCPSIDAWHTYLDGTTTACRLHIPRGTPAIVNSIIPSSPDDIDSNGGGPYVELKALDGSWSGYSLAMVLKPDVPTGITITFDNKSDNQEHFTLDKNPSSSFNLGQDLGNKVTVKLLKYAPNEFRTLYVTVVDGSYAGNTGWVYPSSQAITSDGNSVDALKFERTPRKQSTVPIIPSCKVGRADVDKTIDYYNKLVIAERELYMLLEKIHGSSDIVEAYQSAKKLYQLTWETMIISKPPTDLDNQDVQNAINNTRLDFNTFNNTMGDIGKEVMSISNSEDNSVANVSDLSDNIVKVHSDLNKLNSDILNTYNSLGCPENQIEEFGAILPIENDNKSN